MLQLCNIYEDKEKYSTKGVDLAFKQIVVIMSWKMFYFKPKVYLLNRIEQYSS